MKKKLFAILLGIASLSIMMGCGNTNIDVIPETEVSSDANVDTEETEVIEELVIETETETEMVMEVGTEEATTEENEYTFTDMSKTLYAKSSVNVRDLPDTTGNKVGSLSTNDEVNVTGKCNETGWYRFEYKGSVAYVSDSYLSESKVENTSTATGTTAAAGDGSSSGNGATTTTASTTPCPYPLYTIIDEGGYNIYFYGHWGGSANMPADINAQTDDCISQVSSIGGERLRATAVVPEGGSYNIHTSSSVAWENVGEYAEGTIVRRYFVPGEVTVTPVE